MTRISDRSLCLALLALLPAMGYAQAIGSPNEAFPAGVPQHVNSLAPLVLQPLLGAKDSVNAVAPVSPGAWPQITAQPGALGPSTFAWPVVDGSARGGLRVPGVFVGSHGSGPGTVEGATNLVTGRPGQVLPGIPQGEFTR